LSKAAFVIESSPVSVDRVVRPAKLANRARSVGLRVGVAIVGLALTLSAFGWIYLLRAPAGVLPGPGVSDALILDELAGHSRVSVWLFLLVWGVAALMLAGLARALRLERLQAALILALGVGAWLLILTAFSLYVVRQFPATGAFHVAARTKTVYFPAALAGVFGALLGLPRTRSERRRVHTIFAWLVGAAGVLDVISAITPEIQRRLHILARVASSIPGLASATVVPVGVILLLAARGLARGSRRAWQIAVPMLVTSSLLHLLKGLDYEEATAVGLLAIALIARRHDFQARGDPGANSRVAVRLAAFVAAIFAYGIVALWINQSLADQPFSLPFAFTETGEALIGFDVGGSHHVLGRFGTWFPLSVLLLGLVGVGALLAIWLAPWRYRYRRQVREREMAHVLVNRFGWDTLAPFTLREGKSYFFSEDERVFLAYRVVSGVAVVSGDPVGPADGVGAAIGSFLTFAGERGWRVAILGASERYLDAYRERGLKVLYHGHEAVVETDAFSLDGQPIRKVRQACHRLERLGFAAQIAYAADLDDATRPVLARIFRTWRGEAPLKGFTMALDDPFRLEGNEALFVIGRDAEGAARGFLHFAVSRPGSALSLSSMPRGGATPNGFNEWLIVQSVFWAKENGFAKVSLNFAPFAALLGLKEDLSPAERFERNALRSLKAPLKLQLDNLFMFNEQFHPHWQPRFVVFEGWTDLPRVGLAGLSAEGYLPFGAKNGANGTPAKDHIARPHVGS
jgi:lysyl-tRNA synthetase class 2